jgi:hypothetical protein
MVVRRRHLDDVDSPDRKLARESPHSIEKLSTGQPPRFWRSGTGSHPGIHDVYVQ